LTTSIPLSFGYLLAYSEWELLTVFAKFLGPAEVATWGLLGTVWDVLEATTEAISEAGEVRCAYLLGAGRFDDARVSAFKSMFLAFFASVLLSSIVLMCGESLAVWMTDDPTLQGLMSDLIPLFAMGNVALTTGTTAWTLVGAQGRYSLSTAVGFAGSWFVTVPLSALSSVALAFDLRGQTAAVVAGYMVSGFWNLFFLLRSDWQAISEKVIAYNAANDIELDSDQVSSSEEEDESSRHQPQNIKK
jgi:Na+-driven multidrug efflux pump